MNAPVKRLMSLAGDPEKLEDCLLSIEMAFTVKDHALRVARSILEREDFINEPVAVNTTYTVGQLLTNALLPWSHNSDEIKP